jgi:predicted peroxiredoxin
MPRQGFGTFCLAAVAIACLAGLACQPAKDPAAGQKPAPKPVVLILTGGASEVSRYMMALGLAGSAIEEGRNVVVFLDVKAPELAKRVESTEPFVAGKKMDAASDMSGGPGPKEMLKTLIARGATVAACPMCMSSLQITQQSLMDGVVLLTNAELLAKTNGATVYSY